MTYKTLSNLKILWMGLDDIGGDDPYPCTSGSYLVNSDVLWNHAIVDQA